MGNFSCAKCGVTVLVKKHMFFLGMKMVRLRDVIRQTIFPSQYASTSYSPTYFCKNCVLAGTTVRAIAVINPYFFEPFIAGWQDLTQLELLHTIIPNYDVQTQELKEFGRKWLKDLPDSGFLTPEQLAMWNEVIGISFVNG